MNNNRIIILGLGHLSNGELTIAVETVRHLPKKGFVLFFVSHPTGANYLMSAGMDCLSLDRVSSLENRRLFEKMMADFKPDRILLADAYTMEYAAFWSGIDFEYLKSFSLPLGSFDQYEWESTNFEWDFAHTPLIRMQPDLIRNCDFLIRPCPLNKLGATTDRRILTCRLFGLGENQPKMNRNDWASSLSISLQNKIIFIVNSGWEYVDVSNSPTISSMIEQMPRLIHGIITLIGTKVTVVHVGPRRWSFPINPLITYYHFSNLNADLYRECIAHSDLFMGTNAISITLSNAVYMGTPSILLNNSKVLDFKKIEGILPRMPLWYQEMAQRVPSVFAFRMFPWGWKKFLDYVFTNNPYNDTFVTAPVLEPLKCKKMIDQYLFDKDAITEIKVKQHAYFECLSELEPLEKQLLKLSD
jgi:hypothetical protein